MEKISVAVSITENNMISARMGAKTYAYPNTAAGIKELLATLQAYLNPSK